jgi:Cu(I)/Ag(I) efflux system membrane fusion protein
MPGDFGKMQKYVEWAKQKLLFLLIAKLKVLKALQISLHYFYSTYSGYISEITTTEGSYGRALPLLN